MTLNQNKHMISLLFYYIYWLFLLCFLLVLFHVVVLLMSQSNFQLFIFWVVCVWCSLGVVMYVLYYKCCGDATIFLPWVLHFWGCGFATGVVILGVGNNLN